MDFSHHLANTTDNRVLPLLLHMYMDYLRMQIRIGGACKDTNFRSDIILDAFGQ